MSCGQKEQGVTLVTQKYVSILTKGAFFMTVDEVLDTLQARDIQLMVEGDQLRYDAPEDAITDEVLTLLRQHKAALLALLTNPTPAATEDNTGQRPESPEAVRPSRPFSERPGACYACGTTRRWRSVCGTVVCARCHPPADAALVAGWEGAA
jgi:hypothetical protein